MLFSYTMSGRSLRFGALLLIAFLLFCSGSSRSSRLFLSRGFLCGLYLCGVHGRFFPDPLVVDRSRRADLCACSAVDALLRINECQIILNVDRVELPLPGYSIPEVISLCPNEEP